MVEVVAVAAESAAMVRAVPTAGGQQLVMAGAAGLVAKEGATIPARRTRAAAVAAEAAATPVVRGARGGGASSAASGHPRSHAWRYGRSAVGSQWQGVARRSRAARSP